MKANGNKVCPMVLEFTPMPTAQSIKESGIRTNSKDKEPRYGLMELLTKVSSTTGLSLDLVR